MIPAWRHFGLTDAPFTLTPNPHLYFAWRQPETILAGLECALGRGDGVLHVNGAVGSGKTLLSRLLLARLAQAGTNTAYLNAPVADAAQLPALVLQEFGIPTVRGIADYRTLGNALLRGFGTGRRNVLVVDEAQALSQAGLECLRLLSNLESATHKLLQIVLFGPPELGVMLSHPPLQQLTQRIAFSFTTEPLPACLTGDYVHFRLRRCAGPTAQTELFDAGALDLLANASQGWPRLINLLADKALLAAYAKGETRIRRTHIRAAITDTPHLTLPLPWRDRVASWRRAA